MEKSIIVLDAEEKQCENLCNMLEMSRYHVTPTHSLSDLERLLSENERLAVIIDIDTVPINNHTIRGLTLKNPGTYFLCMSASRFHPELKDAICYHIYACLNKPVDPDELLFWLRSICENAMDASNQKNH